MRAANGFLAALFRAGGFAMIRVIDGARAADGANNAADIAVANYASEELAEGIIVDMALPGHRELIFNAATGATETQDTSVAVTVAEANDPNDTFETVPGALIGVDGPNASAWGSVNWNHPERKRYARLQAFPEDGWAIFGASSLRVAPCQEIDADDGIVAV